MIYLIKQREWKREYIFKKSKKKEKRWKQENKKKKNKIGQNWEKITALEKYREDKCRM